MEREIIYGVIDKTGKCDSYVGFFKTEEGAIKELENQSIYCASKHGLTGFAGVLINELQK